MPLKTFVLAVMTAGVAAAAHAATLAVVNGEKITTADIVAAEGKTPTGDALNQAVDRFIERKLLAARARAEGVDVPPALLARGYELAHRAWGPNRLTDDAAFRRYLNEGNPYPEIYGPVHLPAAQPGRGDVATLLRRPRG